LHTALPLFFYLEKYATNCVIYEINLVNYYESLEEYKDSLEEN